HSVENVNLESAQRTPKTEFEDVADVAAEMIEQISEGSGGKRRRSQPQPPVFLKVTNISGEEEELHQQFFEVVIEAVPELRDGGGIERLVGVAKYVEPGHP